MRRGRPYAGWSAGANLACPTIRTTNDMPIVEPRSLSAMGLLPFQLNPHYTERRLARHGGETRDQRIAEFRALNRGVPVLGLREGSLLRLEGRRLAASRRGCKIVFRQDEVRISRPVASTFPSSCDERQETLPLGEESALDRYHDREWGVPVRRDRTFFEFLILEGAQAGLSWDTILAKRENYRKAFDGFDPEEISKYTEKKKKALLETPGIVRNRLKIESAVVNAKCFLALQKEYGSFSAYVWGSWTKPLQPAPIHGDGAGANRGLGRAVEGPEAARLQVRGLDHPVRFHAGHGPGRRSRAGMLPIPENTPDEETASALPVFCACWHRRRSPTTSAASSWAARRSTSRRRIRARIASRWNGNPTPPTGAATTPRSRWAECG